MEQSCLLKSIESLVCDRLAQPVSGNTDFNLDKLLEAASFHGLEATLLRYCGADESRWPLWFMNRLRLMVRARQVTTLKMLWHTEKIEKRAFEAGIETTVFKGAWLSRNIYPAKGGRFFSDIDFFVSADKAQAFIGLLLADGCKPYPHLTPRQQCFQLKERGAVNVMLPEGFCIDVHTRIIESRYPHSLTFERAKAADNCHEGFSSEAHLLFLILHGTKHFWRKLVWVQDCLLLLKSFDETSREKFEKLTSDCRAASWVQMALSFFSELFPESPVKKISKAQIDRRPAAGVFLAESQSENENPLTEMKRQLALFQTPRQKLFYIFKRALTPDTFDYMWRRIPDRLFWLYLPVRLVRLAFANFRQAGS